MADTALPPLTNDLRCAPQAVELGLDPRGTATRCSTLVLIEYPGLWPARIEDTDLVAGLPPLPADHRILLTRGPDGGVSTGADSPALSVWRAGDDLRFTGVDYEVVPGRLPEAIEALADGADPAHAEGVMTIGAAPTEVLICGHGRRDTCCGSYGVRLLQQAEARAWPGVRVRRCSHTGGHRFAPTGLSLPEGRMWAFLDIDLLEAIVTGRDEPGLATANRGLMAIDPLAQVAEGALFERTGSAWRAAEPRVTIESSSEGGATYDITWSVGGEPAGRARVEVRRAGAVPVPACGLPIGEAKKTSAVYEVVAIESA